MSRPGNWAKEGLSGLAFVAFGVLWAGCADDSSLSIAIVSPEPGQSFFVGQPIVLDAEVTGRKGEDAEQLPTWAFQGTWQATGNSILGMDLPQGEGALSASVDTPDGPAMDEVVIAVEAREVSFEGMLELTIFLRSSRYEDRELPCDHKSLSFVLDPTGTLVGEGACMVLGVTEYSFAIQGELDGLEVAGTMQSPDTEEALEFTGEIGVDGSISAAFDTTWVNDKEE